MEEESAMGMVVDLEATQAVVETSTGSFGLGLRVPLQVCAPALLKLPGGFVS